MKRLFRAAILLAAALLAAPRPVLAASGEASPYGVNAHAPEGDDLRRLLDLAQAARLGWIRIDFIWSWVEPVKGAREWRVYDGIVTEARGRGIEVYASLVGTPAWATDGPEAIGVPRDVSEWRAFVRDAARRYCGRVKAWGVWNEPNLPAFWAGTRVQYMDVLLRPASEEIRKADPDALVGGPDLAHLKGGGAEWYSWLYDVLRFAGDALDVVTHHVYDQGDNGDVTRKLDASTAFGGNPQRWDVVAPSVREVLREAGASGKPFWLTETGWASDAVGEATQSAWLVELLRDWFGRPGEPSWVKKVFLYELADDPGAGVPKWGLLRADRSAKPSYTGVATFTSSYRPYGDAAELVEAAVPQALVPGVPATARITLRNSGRSTWTREGGYALAPLGDAALLSPGRVPLASGLPVPTLGTATFAFPVTASREGAFAAEWRLVSVEGTPFGPAVARTVHASGACPVPAAPALAAGPGGSVVAGTVASFGWETGTEGVARWRVQVGRDSAFDAASLLLDAEVPSPAFAWRAAVAPGTLAAFRVAAVNGCAVSGPFSSSVPFAVVVAPRSVVPVRGQGAPWLVKAGAAAPTAPLAFRDVGGGRTNVTFETTDAAFAVTPLSASLGPGEEAMLLLSARPGATAAPGVRAGRVVARWSDGSSSTPVALAVQGPGETGGARITVAPQELLLLAPEEQPSVAAELVVTNPGPLPALLAPMAEPGGGWLSVDRADLAKPIAPGESRRVRLTADRRLRASEDGAPPVRTVLALVAAGGAAEDRVEVPVVDASPAPRFPGASRGPVPPGFSSWIVPTAVRQAGAFGQRFSSSLEIRNLGTAPADVNVWAAEAGTDGDAAAVRATLPLPSAGSVLLDEALPILFGLESGAAHLELRSSASLAVRSVVVGRSAGGARFSAEVPVVAAGEGTGSRRPPPVLPGLKVTAAVRCNLILAETGGSPARVALRLFDAAGKPLGRGEAAVPAWGNAQVSLPAAVGLAGVVPEGSTLRVEPLEGEGRVVALATLIDNVSASFSVVTGRPAPQDGSDGSGPQTVASVVQAAGVGAYFTTELSIATAAPNAAPLTLTYDYAGTDAEGLPTRGRVAKDVTLARDGALPPWYGRNVVGSLFDLGARTSTSGSLRIEGDGAGRVQARAAVSTPLDVADPSKGTMTAELPATGPRSPEAVGWGAPGAVLLPGLRASPRERVNLIVSEVAGAPARVSVALLADGDVPRGTLELALGPFEKLQVNDLWNGPSGFGLGPLPVDRLTLAASGPGEGTGRAVVAVTTVDNETNGTRIQLLAPPGPAPLGGPSGR